MSTSGFPHDPPLPPPGGPDSESDVFTPGTAEYERQEEILQRLEKTARDERGER